MPTFPPFNAIVAYTPFNVVAYSASLIGMTLDFAGNATLIDISTPAYTGTLATYTNAGPSINGVQFSDSELFALGLNVPLQIYHNGTITTVGNTFQDNTNYPPWLAATQYPQGTRIIATATDSNTYIFGAFHGGTSGSSMPAFPPAYHAKVVDNSVTWRNLGVANQGLGTGAGFVFNHLNSLWIWGTAATYLANGVDGPDALRMSDQGNPTSYDPANAAFIGQGDGQLPMGGGTWTQLELGIAATSQLILFKGNATYSVLGAFPSDVPGGATIQSIPDGVGCCAPNTVQFVPGIGLMRLSNQGIAVFNGERDVVDQFTDPIRPYLFPTTPVGVTSDVNNDINPVDWSQIIRCSSAQTVNPPGYLLLCPLQGSNGALTRGFLFDRSMKAWTVIDWPLSMPLGCGYFQQHTNQQAQCLLGGFSDGIVRAWAANDEFFDTEPNTPIAWRFRTPALGAPGTPIFLNYGRFRASLRGSIARLAGAVMYEQSRNGQPQWNPVQLNANQQYLTQSIRIGRTSLGGSQIEFQGSGRIVMQGLEVDYVPKPPSRISG